MERVVRRLDLLVRSSQACRWAAHLLSEAHAGGGLLELVDVLLSWVTLRPPPQPSRTPAWALPLEEVAHAILRFASAGVLQSISLACS
jgi:hypothetical protein